MKTYLSALLWTFALWYVGAGVTAVLGLPEIIAPLVGFSAGLFVFANSRRLIPITRLAQRP